MQDLALIVALVLAVVAVVAVVVLKLEAVLEVLAALLLTDWHLHQQLAWSLQKS
jgi:hypothetical protein